MAHSDSVATIGVRPGFSNVSKGSAILLGG